MHNLTESTWTSLLTFNDLGLLHNSEALEMIFHTELTTVCSDIDLGVEREYFLVLISDGTLGLFPWQGQNINSSFFTSTVKSTFLKVLKQQSNMELKIIKSQTKTFLQMVSRKAYDCQVS